MSSKEEKNEMKKILKILGLVDNLKYPITRGKMMHIKILIRK